MSFKYFDAHGHINSKEYDNDRESVIKRACDSGVLMVDIGCDPQSAIKSIEISKNHHNIFSAIGFHPEYSEEKGENGFDIDFYYNLATDPKVVAIGECGLDYFCIKEEGQERENVKNSQRKIFEEQIEIANRLGKPLMLHIRNRPGSNNLTPKEDAYEDAMDILKEKAEVHGNVHFFAGTKEQARKFFDMGFTISFTGVITFARNYDEIIKEAPIDMILSETDCPFVAPIPFRGKRNEPLYIKEIVSKMAEIRGDKEGEKTEKALFDNAMRFFNISL